MQHRNSVQLCVKLPHRLLPARLLEDPCSQSGPSDGGAASSSTNHRKLRGRITPHVYSFLLLAAPMEGERKRAGSIDVHGAW